MTIEEAMRIAVAHHQAGRLGDAEGIYRQVLAQVPDHADALHLLGVVASQTGHLEEAIDLIGRAIAIDPASAEHHSNLGEVLRRSGACDSAMASFRRAIERRPSLVTAHNGLGIILKEQGRLDEAIDAFHQAIEHRPDFAEARTNLGSALKSQGRLDEAIDAHRRAIELRPDYAEAHSNLGNALKELGRLDEAVAAHQRAIQLRPGYAEAHSNLGNVLLDQGRLDEAIDAYRQCIALRPELAEAHGNLGNSLKEQGRLDEARAAYERAIALRPELAESHNNLGSVLKEQGRLAEAIAAFHRAIELRPNLAEAEHNLGNALEEQGQLDEAIDAYRRAIALRPDLAEAHNNLGSALKDQGRIDEALECLRRALAINPNLAIAADNLLYFLHFHPGVDRQAILAEHCEWARRYAAPLMPQILAHDNERSADRRLTVGFVSPDFRSHPVGQLLEPLFAHLDRGRTEIVCYSDVRNPDRVTAKLKDLTGAWHDTAGWSDQRVADQIRAGAIDILVDLSLHTAGNRMLVFARKPAPVQVTMLGMPSTTGLATIDYRLTDRYLDPPGAGDDDYSEQSIRLPHGFWCYQPLDDAPAVSALPMRRNGFVTFGCLNQLAKVSTPVLQEWVAILQSVPGSRLVLSGPSGSRLDTLRGVFREGGIAPERLELVAKVPHLQYLQRYHDLDIAFDPFPYTGGTTTMDALWMGVPVITLAGRTAVARGGASVLSNVSLPELIAETSEAYRNLAIQWAGDPVRLAAVRAGLRERMRSSPLMDGQRYAADVEAAFRRMWATWCGHAPRSAV